MHPIVQRTVAFFGTLIALPVLALVAVAIWWDDGLPILFRQKRVGRGGAELELLKFRSMRNAAGGPQITAGGDARVTRVGRILRKYKLDELPQLIHVVRGEMSLVGPRPEVPRYVDSSPLWREVLTRNPGITDLATLYYRNEEEVLAGQAAPEAYYRDVLLPQKLRLNVQYAGMSSLWNDVRLLFLTAYYSLFPSRFDAERVERAFSTEGIQ